MKWVMIGFVGGIVAWLLMKLVGRLTRGPSFLEGIVHDVARLKTEEVYSRDMARLRDEESPFDWRAGERPRHRQETEEDEARSSRKKEMLAWARRLLSESSNLDQYRRRLRSLGTAAADFITAADIRRVALFRVGLPPGSMWDVPDAETEARVAAQEDSIVSWMLPRGFKFRTMYDMLTTETRQCRNRELADHILCALTLGDFAVLAGATGSKAVAYRGLLRKLLARELRTVARRDDVVFDADLQRKYAQRYEIEVGDETIGLGMNEVAWVYARDVRGRPVADALEYMDSFIEENLYFELLKGPIEPSKLLPALHCAIGKFEVASPEDGWALADAYGAVDLIEEAKVIAAHKGQQTPSGTDRSRDPRNLVQEHQNSRAENASLRDAESRWKRRLSLCRAFQERYADVVGTATRFRLSGNHLSVMIRRNDRDVDVELVLSTDQGADHVETQERAAG